MTFTTTGIAFSLSSMGLIFCGFWFFRAFQKIGGLRSGNLIGILLSVFYLGLAFQHAILAIAGLFFWRIPEGLYALLVIAHLVLTIVTVLGVYLAIYILSPRYSPLPSAIATFFLGLWVVILTIMTHPQPFINSSKGIDWNMSPALEVALYYLLLLSLSMPLIIFLKNFFHAKSRDVKFTSLAIILVQLGGIINVSIRFVNILWEVDDINTHIFEIILGTIGIIFILSFLLIPLIRTYKYNSKI